MVPPPIGRIPRKRISQSREFMVAREWRVLGWPAMADEECPPQSAHHYAQLLSLAAHEFRTPASVVGGYLRMLQRDTDPPLSERQRKMVDEAVRSCARLVELITEMSDLSKLDSDALPLRTERFDLFTLLSELAKDVHEGEDREVRLHISGPPEGAFVVGDRPRMAAAFGAFIRAILREQPTAGTVVAERRMVVDRGQRSATVVVAAQADVQRAYNGTPTTLNEKRGGIGLSLPIARRIVERHGGRVWSPAPAGADDRGLKSALVVSIPLGE